MTKIKKIEKFESDSQNGFEVHDAIRSGRSPEIDPLRLATVIQEIKDKLNEVIDKLNA